MFRKQLFATGQKFLSRSTTQHRPSSSFLFTASTVAAGAALFTVHTSSSTNSSPFSLMMRHFSTGNSNSNSNNGVLLAEEASSINAPPTATATATKKRYTGTPPEVDDTDRYVMTEENPLRALLSNGQPLDITLYQYQVCPFCCKVRSFLDFYNIPYKIVEVNPITKSEIKFSKEYKRVPIILINGLQINDSSKIVSALNDLMTVSGSTTTTTSTTLPLAPQLTPEERQREVKWRKWVDHKLVHTLPPNIYRNPQEALDAFEYISTMNNFSWHQKMVAKYAGGLAMWGVSKKLKTKHGIEDEREALFDCANEWVEELGGKTFHGGDKPNLADLATYGALSSIEGLAAFHDMTKATKIGKWYLAMKQAVGECSGKR